MPWSSVSCLLIAASGGAAWTQRFGHDIEDYATIEAYTNDVPVYAFGYTYVYGVSPDLLPGVVMQRGNSHPVVKITPKKSWEIEHNLCGSTPAREPKTMWNDDQPLLSVHLIDGDPETAWSSRGQATPDAQPRMDSDRPARREHCRFRGAGLRRARADSRGERLQGCRQGVALKS